MPVVRRAGSLLGLSLPGEPASARQRQMTSHPHIEDAFVLGVTELLAAHASGKWSVPAMRPSLPWSAGGCQEVVFKLRLGEVDGSVTLTYAAGPLGQEGYATDTIILEATRPHYGGVRWWFRCGISGKRASKLYLFPDHQRFCHRTGLGLNPTYLSQRVSGMDKVFRRLWSLRQSIPDQGSILELLKRPPRMHVKTYVRLLKREAAIWDSPDNTLPALLRELGLSKLESRDNSHII